MREKIANPTCYICGTSENLIFKDHLPKEWIVCSECQKLWLHTIIDELATPEIRNTVIFEISGCIATMDNDMNMKKGWDLITRAVNVAREKYSKKEA